MASDRKRLNPTHGVGVVWPDLNRKTALDWEELFLRFCSKVQQAKSWDSARRSMARLWRDQGKRTEARELLAPVYGWFTEGFDTRDLKEAMALLEELAA
jgi:predicted ATPase